MIGDVTQVVVPTRTLTPVDRIRYPAVAAHRGGRDLYPEGSMTAFEAVTAAHPGVVLEMDVRPLKDGTLVVCHDATVDRIAVGGKTGRVDAMSPAQWSSLQVHNTDGTTTGPAAFLSDVLARFGGTNTVLMIELKDYTDAARNEYVRQCWPYRDQIIGCCFDQGVNRVIAGSGFHGQYLASSPSAVYPDGMNCVALAHTTIAPAVVSAVHAKGQRLWAWTVNDTSTKNALYAMGVDGIITDNPDL